MNIKKVLTLKCQIVLLFLSFLYQTDAFAQTGQCRLDLPVNTIVTDVPQTNAWKNFTPNLTDRLKPSIGCSGIPNDAIVVSAAFGFTYSDLEVNGDYLVQVTAEDLSGANPFTTETGIESFNAGPPFPPTHSVSTGVVNWNDWRVNDMSFSLFGKVVIPDNVSINLQTTFLSSFQVQIDWTTERPLAPSWANIEEVIDESGGGGMIKGFEDHDLFDSNINSFSNRVSNIVWENVSTATYYQIWYGACYGYQNNKIGPTKVKWRTTYRVSACNSRGCSASTQATVSSLARFEPTPIVAPTCHF